MKNIQEDIKTGNFKQAYLLYGEEAYLKQQYKHKLVQALNPEDDTMNFNHYEGRNIDVKELIDLCETMPFFADRRVVLLEDTGFFKNKCDELADYMKENANALGCRASEKRRQDDHPAGYGTPSYHDWRGYGKPADGTGKDNFLYR